MPGYILVHVPTYVDCELAVAVALQLVWRHIQTHNAKQIDCQGREVIDLPWLLVTIIREQHFL
jgi:hypothetical protein